MLSVIKFLFIFYVPCSSLLVANKFTQMDAVHKLHFYNSNKLIDDKTYNRLSKSFISDHDKAKRDIENMILNSDKIRCINLEPGSLEFEIAECNIVESHNNNELILYEFSNKIYKHENNNKDALINEGKCAFIGYFDNNIFKPYFGLVIKNPNIIPLVINQIPMNLGFIDKRIYLEYVYLL